MFTYYLCVYIVASRQGVDHRRPGNAALLITTKHLHLRLMSSTPAAHEGCSLKWGEKTPWGGWTEAPGETELTCVFSPNRDRLKPRWACTSFRHLAAQPTLGHHCTTSRLHCTLAFLWINHSLGLIQLQLCLCSHSSRYNIYTGASQ